MLPWAPHLPDNFTVNGHTISNPRLSRISYVKSSAPSQPRVRSFSDDTKRPCFPPLFFASPAFFLPGCMLLIDLSARKQRLENQRAEVQRTLMIVLTDGERNLRRGRENRLCTTESLLKFYKFNVVFLQQVVQASTFPVLQSFILPIQIPSNERLHAI